MQDLHPELPGPVLAPPSALAPMIRDAFRAHPHKKRLPQDQLDTISQRCGPAEIHFAIAWLDELARERRTLPEGQHESLARIVRLQEMLHEILSRVPRRYFDHVAAGLDSSEGRTRVHVAMALDALDRAAALPWLRDALANEPDDHAGQVMDLMLARAESESV